MAIQFNHTIVDAVDRDTDAFNRVLAARRMPQKSEEEARRRLEAIDSANEAATRVPLDVLEHAVEALELAGAVARGGNPASVSDAGVVFISELAGNRIKAYDENGLMLARSDDRQGVEFSSPHGLAAYGMRLYVADEGNHRIQELLCQE